MLIALAGLVGLLCYGRLYFGVDPGDESFYAAMPYEYVLGNRPYVDELNVHPGQSFALLTYPLVRAYYAAASQDGLVLALRHAYFAFAGGVTLLSVLLLRRVIAWPWLLAAGLGYLSLVPFSIPSLSYNTLAAGFLTYGFIFGLGYLVASRARRLLCLAGLCHALAAVAYPPLLLVIPVYALVLGVLRRGTRVPDIFAYCLGALVVLGVWGAAILMIGPSNVLHAFSFGREMAGSAEGSAGLWRSLLVNPVPWAATVAPALLLAIAAIVAGRKRTAMRRWCIALIPVSGLSLVATGASPIYWSVTYIILLALYSCLMAWYQLEQSDVRRSLILWGLVPALFAGYVSGNSSLNDFIAAWVGLAPSVVIAFVATGLAVRSAAAPPERTHAAWLRLTPVVAVLVAGLLFQWMAVYGDSPVPQLTARVDSGPYRGLFTTPDRRALVQGLAADIDAMATPTGTILFLHQNAGGYLLSALRPAGPSVWLGGAETNPTVHSWYDETGRAPTVVVSFRASSSATVQRELHLWGSPYEAVFVRGAYVVYRRATEVRSALRVLSITRMSSRRVTWRVPPSRAAESETVGCPAISHVQPHLVCPIPES